MSMLASAELPAVIVNVQRGGPGIGSIQPSQADYFQMTRGGGNGDYRILSLAPASVQEGAEMMLDAFALAEKYRMPVFIVSDGMLGQMMEPVELPKKSQPKFPDKPWAAVGHGNTRSSRVVKTLALDPTVLEARNLELQTKYARLAEAEVRFATHATEDAEIVLCAYGSTARIVRNAIDMLREENIAAGLIRPQTLWPFPVRPFTELPSCCGRVLTVEMSCGQMVDDVRLAVAGRLPVSFYGRSGGIIPVPEEIVREVKKLLGRA
jgi:2-oxoglutarate ferredoxin oxidoreductase subunit alpha